MRYLILILLLTVLCVSSSTACEESEKVFDRQSASAVVTNAVFVCSTDGMPSVQYKHWICRTNLAEEGDDKEYVYLPPCSFGGGYKSEYQHLMENKYGRDNK